MRRICTGLVVAAGFLLAPALPATAQIYITPSAGAFIPASDLDDLRDRAEQAELDRSATLGLGLNIEAGWLRGSIAYATGATIKDRSVENRGDIGDGSVLAVAADLVIRPLPRVLVQPYLLAGAGFKRQDFSFNDGAGFGDLLPEDRTDFALHAGLGADLMLGGLGIMVEISDFISRNEENSFGQHDAFAFVGLKFRVGGR
jgi:hypothetical protein